MSSNNPIDFFSIMEDEESDNQIPDFVSQFESPTQESIEGEQPNSTIDFVSEMEGPSKEQSFIEKGIDYFKKLDIGQAAAYQIKSGGFSGAPAATPEIARDVATEVGTIAAIEGLFAPIGGLAAASKYAPKLLSALTRTTKAATTGVATAATSNLVREGELPSKDDLIQHGLTGAAVSVLLDLAHVSTAFGAEARQLSKKYNVPQSTVYKAYWQQLVKKAKKLFGIETLKKSDLKKPEIKKLADQTIKDIGEKDIKAIADQPIEAEVVSVESIKKPTDITPADADIRTDKTKPLVIEKTPIEVKEQPKKPEVTKKSTPKPTTIEDREKTKKIFNKNIKMNNEESKKTIIQSFPHLKEKDISFNSMTMFGQPWREIIIKSPISGKTLKQGGKTWNSAARDIVDFVYDDLLKKPPKPIVVLPLTKKEKPQPKPLAKQATQETPKEAAYKKPIIGKKQAAKRSEIINLFRKAFKDPIRLRKFNQRAAGIHKLWPKVTRLLQDNDIETAAHEIGHNLHTTLYGGDAKTPREQFDNVHKALKPYLDELKPLAHYAPFGAEGFAEFTRMYVTNPEAAKKLAPKFYDKFEKDLDKDYPELKEALLKAREYYDSYIQGTPESRIDAQTSYTENESRLNNIVDWVKNNLNLDELNKNWLDNVYPAKRLVAEAFGISINEVENLGDERNLYRSLRLLKGAIGKGDVFLGYETFNANTLEKTGEGLKAIMDDLSGPKEYKEFNRFLIARRALEKANQLIQTGINYEDARIVYDKFEKKYLPLAKRLDKYNDQLLLYAKDSDLLSNEQYQEIKRNNLSYVPFQRVLHPEKSKGGGISKSLQAGKAVKRMKGSTRDIIDPLESIFKNTYSVIVNAEKNRSGLVLAKLSEMKDMGKYVERVPTPVKLKAKITREEIESGVKRHLKKTGQNHLLKETPDGIKLIDDVQDILPDILLKFGASSYPAGENIITVYKNGKPQYYEVAPELFEMWTKGISQYTSNLLVKILRIPGRTLRAGAILNPKFIQKNFIRDTWGGMLFTKYGKSIKDPGGLLLDTIYQPLAMLAQATKQGPIYVEWLKAGGGLSTMQSIDRASVIKHIDEVKRKYKPKQIVKWLRLLGEISEEGNRLAEFSRALEITGKSRLGREIAAFASRDLSIDFAKMGLMAHALNQMIPFFNATLQGGNKLIRALSNKEDREKLMPRIIAGIVIPSLILAWVNKDDEDIKELQDQEKDFNFLFKIGDTIYKIPVPFEIGVANHGLTQRMFDYFVNKNPDAFEGFFGSILDASLPSFIPAFANPFIEAQANKNFFTGGRIIPLPQEKLVSRLQFKTYTSLTSRMLGRALSYMLGPDTRSKLASPAIIDHFINAWGGGLGRLMVKISDASLEAAGLGDKIPKPNQTIIEKLELNAFATRYPRSSTKSIEKFYDNYQDAKSRLTSKKYAKKYELYTDEEIESAEDRIEKLYDMRTLDRAYKAIQMSQKEINNIMRDPDIQPEEKRQLVDELYIQMIDFAKEANKDIKEHILDRK